VADSTVTESFKALNARRLQAELQALPPIEHAVQSLGSLVSANPPAALV